MEDQKLTLFEKNVFTTLVTFAGSGKIFPGREQICKRMGRKRTQTVSSALGRLKESGYITIQRRNNKSSNYGLCGVTMPVSNGYVKASEINFPKC